MKLTEIKDHLNILIKEGYGDKEIIRVPPMKVESEINCEEIKYNKTYDKVFI